MQQVVESKAMTALPSEQQFNLRMLLPRKPEQPVPYAPYSAPPAPMMAHGIPQAHPMQPPFRVSCSRDALHLALTCPLSALG